MTMTSTYDHRVIQGAESGSFLRRVDQLLQGADGFYDDVFDALGLGRRAPRTPPRRRQRDAEVTAHDPAPAAHKPGVTGVVDEALLQAVQAATSIVKAHRMHGHLAARPRPARLRAARRPGARPGDRQPDARADARRSRRRSCASRCPARRSPTRCRTCRRPTAARSPTRSSTSPTTSSASGCGRRSSPASTSARRLDRQGQEAPAAPPVRGRGARVLPAQGVPREEAVLDRGPRHDACRCSTRCCTWPPRPARARSSSAWPTAAG